MGSPAGAVELLRGARTILLVDWPSRDVPDTLARSGLRVIADEGPDQLVAYQADGGEVRARPIDGAPARMDIVYAFRPLGELPAIIEQARSVGARAVWIQSGRNSSGGRDPRGCWLAPEESAGARSVVESAGLAYVEAPYIADAARSMSGAG